MRDAKSSLNTQELAQSGDDYLGNNLYLIIIQ
mgnify:CR=1 FL=1